MSAAHYFGKERRVSVAHEIDERVNVLFLAQGYVVYILSESFGLHYLPNILRMILSNT